MTAAIDATPRFERRANGRISPLDRLVERWNGLSAAERRRRRTICTRSGHDWAEVRDGGAVLWTMCRVCCEVAR